VACRVCDHRDRGEIEAAVLAGTATFALSRRYGIPNTTLRRHIAEHIGRALTISDGQSVDPNLPLIEQMQRLQARTVELLEAAHKSKQSGVALQAIREARANIQLWARLTGQIDGDKREGDRHLHLTWPDFLRLYEERPN
jgi:hypothetical protein